MMVPPVKIENNVCKLLQLLEDFVPDTYRGFASN